jgi:D-alanyl-D-alanine carboxypeptidase (penicillin-binding protein 5/6)
MNAEAARLHLTATSYANPVGLDDPRNHSSARDLASLASVLLRDPRFASVVDLPRTNLTSGAHPRVVFNRNRLVGRVPFVIGVKTGHTRAAGYVLVAAAQRAGARLVSVVLGEPSQRARDSESLRLLRYGLDQYVVRRIVSHARTVALSPVKWFDGVRVGLRPARDVTLSLRPGEPIEVRAYPSAGLVGPLPAGKRVGSMAVTVAGRPVARVGLVTAERVPGASFMRRLAVRVGRATWTLVCGFVAIALLAALRLRRSQLILRGRGPRT